MESKNIIREKLQRFADKLIDLSKRNRMISSNFQSKTKTHFRIIDEIPDLLYKKLLEGEMKFVPLPSLESEPTDENTPEFKKELSIQEETDQEYIETIKKIEENQEDDLNEAREKAFRQLKDKVRNKRREMGLKITDYSENEALWEALNRYYVLLRMTFDTSIYKMIETGKHQIYRFAMNQQAPMPQTNQAGGIAEIDLICNKSMRIQANIGKKQTLKGNNIEFPKNNQLKCLGCQAIMELSDVRRELEAKTRQRLV